MDALDLHQFCKEAKKRPDYLIPFRQHAPCAARASQTIYADHSEISSIAGLFNILCYRGVFYGSLWAIDLGPGDDRLGVTRVRCGDTA